jgi:glutathione S-transferase
MKIYGSRTRGNPRRVAIYLEEKGIEIPFEVVDLMAGAHRDEGFKKINPVRQVPVLELDDGTHIAETVAICRYFEELHPEPPLFGTTAFEKATIEMWQRRIEFQLYGPARYYLRHTMAFAKALEARQFPDWGERNKEWVLDGLRILDDQLANNEFAAGPTYSVADITAQFAIDMVKMSGIGIPDDYPNITRWYEAMNARTSSQATRADS